MQLDLHIHSDCSADGELSPEALATLCRTRGMDVVAVTDHNSVRGVARAQAAAQGMRVVPGVELDCTFRDQNLHLLGYGFDPTAPAFAENEQDILRQERAAAEQRVRLFCSAAGVPLELQAVLDAAPDGVVTGELIAEFALARPDAAQYDALAPYLPGGAKSDMPNVRLYWDFFAQGKVAYVPIRYLPLADAAALIHAAGGCTVLAHPGQNLAGQDDVLHAVLREAVDGVEAFSSYHTAQAAQYYCTLATHRGLLVTCGSDFHGKHKPAISVGGHDAPQEGAWRERLTAFVQYVM